MESQGRSRVVIGIVGSVVMALVVGAAVLFAPLFHPPTVGNSQVNQPTATDEPTQTPTEIPTATSNPPTHSPPTVVPITLTYFDLGTAVGSVNGTTRVTNPTRQFTTTDQFCFVANFSRVVDSGSVSYRIRLNGNTVRSWGAGDTGQRTVFVYAPNLTFSQIISGAQAGNYSVQVRVNGQSYGTINFIYG